MERQKKCLVCNSDQSSKYLVCNDYLVSNENFELVQCSKCGFVYTNPRPAMADIAPYYQSEDYYSHSDQNKSIISAIYNFIRTLNIKNKLSLVQSVAKRKGKLLDYGCGAGLFVRSASDNGWIAEGIEPSKDARLVAEKLGSKVQAPEAINSLTEGSFDVITLWHVLEHLHDINSVIPKLKALLAKEGTLVIAVPNLNSWDAIWYKEKWAAFDVPRHLYHFSQDSIQKLFENFGMRVVNSYPMKFDAYYVSLLSENKSIFAYPRAILSGLRSNSKARRNGEYSSLIYIIK